MYSFDLLPVDFTRWCVHCLYFNNNSDKEPCKTCLSLDIRNRPCWTNIYKIIKQNPLKEN